MATFNKIILVGHLSRDPEVRYTATGTAMATFGLASMSSSLDGRRSP